MSYKFNQFTSTLDVAGIGIGGVIAGGTEASVLFLGSGGILAQDNTNFKYTSATGILQVKQADTFFNYANGAGSVDSFTPVEAGSGTGYAHGVQVTYRAYPAYLVDATYVVGTAIADESVTIAGANSDITITFTTSGGSTTGVFILKSLDNGSTWISYTYRANGDSPWTDDNSAWTAYSSSVYSSSYTQLTRLSYDDGSIKKIFNN